ncbi:3-hydroxybutyrate dehydrogenase [Kordiimonas sediminis]|uniref:3-hydroxybutyrate dehydrogenase n=1 Tax=Kordiimonas sediminis TaxID=1735581 RepID=A0A919E861_9PROT|nr:3-hydroxybutyrate dehydrogenase [Kordiimonas sediminis]GHF22416.1 3-hydroxybutyrate dehydrogenase [Kordiimonas sediminis]
MASLQGKNALVTGSTSGIGLGIARSLAAEGANVILNGFGDLDEINKLCAEIASETGVKVHYIPADLSSGDEATKLVEDSIKTLGSVDILVNNAGIQHVSAVEEFPADKWEKIIAINLSSCFYTSQAALPAMRSAGYGRIVNIASVHGLVASPFKSAYVAAKHGVIGFTKTLGLETAEDENVTVNAICPGYVKTPLVEGQIKDQAKVHGMSEEDVIRNVMLAAQPNKRFVEVSELASMCVLLCSDQGKSFNGTSVAIDGGWTAR